jgi:hypothetical protein
VGTEVTTLTILPPVQPCGGWMLGTENNFWIDIALSGILDMYGAAPTPVENTTWGKIKVLFE